MIEDKTYSVERYTAEIDAKVYIEGFRRADYFIKFCQQCGNYGRRYGCPPFEEEPLAAIEGYDRVRILGVKITPKDKSLPLEAANDLMKPVISELNDKTLEETMQYFKNVKGVTSVEYDHVYRLTDPVKPRLEIK